MVHTLGREYHLSKREIDTYYPEEVVVMLRFLAYDKKDEVLKKALDSCLQNMDEILIQHGEPNEVRENFRKRIQKLQKHNVKISSEHDDDLPDRGRILALKESMKQNHR